MAELEKALDMVIREVAVGAAPLRITDVGPFLRKKWYEYSFSSYFTVDKWSRDHYYVLPLARYVGSLAAELTTAYFDDKQERPENRNEVFVSHADIAAYAVSQLCKPGQYCMDYPLSNYDDKQSEIEKAASQLVRSLRESSEFVTQPRPLRE